MQGGDNNGIRIYVDLNSYKNSCLSISESCQVSNSYLLQVAIVTEDKT